MGAAELFAAQSVPLVGGAGLTDRRFPIVLDARRRSVTASRTAMATDEQSVLRVLFPRRDQTGDRIRIHVRTDDPDQFTDARDVHIDRSEYVLLVPFAFMTVVCWLFTYGVLRLGL